MRDNPGMNAVPLPLPFPTWKKGSAAASSTAPATPTTLPVVTNLTDARELRAPRYTSYPSADRFTESFSARDLAAWLAREGRDPATAWSIYVHVPFCESLCYYCACNRIITRDHARSGPYLDQLEREVDLVVGHLGRRVRVEQMHWGGGSPTFLAGDELTRLARMMRDRFEFTDDGDYSIEVDPRTIGADEVALLASLGFNRMSLGVQDFDPDVQRAVNRIQPAELTATLVHAARERGFRSINFDLILGLPRQTVETFDRTIDQVLQMRPDRIALYHYAHLPERFRAQRLIESSGLPDSEQKAAIMALARRRLGEAGYQHIGIDHFALPDDELAVARRTGHLHRSFQGYTTRAGCNLIGLGVSAISQLGGAYSQNARDIAGWRAALLRGELPVWRGMELDADDQARRDVIMSLMCGGTIGFDEVEGSHGLTFENAFAEELAELSGYREAGLVSLADRRLSVTEAGLPFVRLISATFDRHLRSGPRTATYSRVV